MSAFEWLLRLLKIELRNEVIDMLNVVNNTLSWSVFRDFFGPSFRWWSEEALSFLAALMHVLSPRHLLCYEETTIHRTKRVSHCSSR
jgi:hypothetical protein